MYFAKELLSTKASGARILGGCCGTTPHNIEKIAQLWNTKLQKREEARREITPLRATSVTNTLLEKLKLRKR